MPHKLKNSIQKLSIAIMLVVVIFGWNYPYLGLIVPIVMLTGIIGGFLNGRYVCGNLCPRGMFFDHILARVSPKKPFPRFITQLWFKLLILTSISILFITLIVHNPTALNNIGFTFWALCVFTTIIGVVLGILYHERAWCAFCPIGKLASTLGKNKSPLQLNVPQCIMCAKCERICPMQIPILTDAKSGVLQNPSCLKCNKCIQACPKHAIKKES
jgi:ferredoxin-type protein NapH